MLIRRLETPDEYLAAEALQRSVWRFPARELIPLNELVVLQKHGGVVLGAFDHGRLVGFCFGHPALRGRALYHYSRMLGVLPEHRDSGLGLRLKLAQRDIVCGQGIGLMRWTFDPLQGRNAHFNLEKLGGAVRAYYVNLYPGSGNRFNQGMEADRALVDWDLRAPLPRRRAYDLARYAEAIPTRPAGLVWRAPLAVDLPRGARRVRLEIPDDVEALKKDDLSLARAWRAASREGFRGLLARGFAATGFAGRTLGGRRRSFYLWERR